MKKYIKYFLFIFISTFVPVAIEKYVYPFEPFSIIRFVIVFCLLCFLFSFFVFNRKKELDFIYEKRYILGISLFFILVLFGFHGSSISLYNQVIQPNYNLKNANPIFGTSRTIRGDEWAVTTPTILSQTKNDFNVNSRILNANSRNVTLYPKVVAKTIASIATPNQLGFLFLPTEQAFSFSWYFGYFLLFFVSFELLMLLTKKNKFYSLTGSLLITFSPVVQWWEAWNIIAYGELAIVLFDKFLKQKKLIWQIMLSILIGIIGCCYIMCLYPAWQIPYGFLFLILCIWLMKQNKDTCNIWKILMLVAIILVLIAIIIVPLFIHSYDIYLLISNTSYPGKRLSTGGEGWQNLFNYFIVIFNSFKESSNAPEMSQFISLYPIPIIMGINYIISNKKKYKKDFLLVALTLLSILLTIWNYVTLPEWLAKISLLSMSTVNRCNVVAGFICFILLIYCLSNYEKDIIKKSSKYQNLIIAILTTLFGIYVVKVHYGDYVTNKFILFDILFYVPVIFMCLLNHKKLNKLAIGVLAFIILIFGITVHPLNIGLKSIYDKPISKEIKRLEKVDKNANWATIGTAYYMSNYLVANGADTLNSTNFYPNFQLWDKLELEKDKEIYNRYSHLLIDLTKEKTSLKLNYEDQIELSLSSNDVCKLDLDYLLTTGKNLEEYSNKKVNFSEIYSKDGILIYSVQCN